MAHTTLKLHPIIAHLTAKIAASIVTQPFSLQYRLHTSIGRETWAKLWYCLRALDQKGKGHFAIPITMVEVLTGGDEKSIYRWLKDGKRWGAFRRYSCKQGILSVWMQSLSKCCIRLNLKDFGAVSLQNLLNLRKIRALTTVTITQKLQQRSYYAANCKLKPDYKKLYGAPHPNELLGNIEQSSLKTPSGQVPRVLHISEKRIFVSKGFVSYGTSQKTIAQKLAIHPVTVQRHQKSAGMVKRQLCQAKQEYFWVDVSLVQESASYWVNFSAGDKGIGYDTQGEKIHFSDGIHQGQRKATPNAWDIPAEGFKNRFFRLGKKCFMAKCNIYREDETLKAMWAARREHREKVAQCQLPEISAGQDAGACKLYPVAGGT